MKMTIPSKGDKVYKCFTGELETVTFLEESLADPSCTKPTWLCQYKDGRKFRCGIHSYYTTIEEAYERFIRDCRGAVVSSRESLNNALDRMIALELLVKLVEIKLVERTTDDSYIIANKIDIEIKKCIKILEI